MNTNKTETTPMSRPDPMDQRAPTLEELKMHPREGFQRTLKQHAQETLQIKAAKIHTHFRPGTAPEVPTAKNGSVRMVLESKRVDGAMDDLLAIVEINACFTDGIRTVSGCTFSNDGLFFRGPGHTAVTFTGRGSKTGPDGTKMCRTSSGEKFRQVDGRGILKQRTAFSNN